MPPDPSRRNLRLGYLAVAVSAILFSAKAVLIKMSYRYGVEPVVFMALRMLFCLPFFAAMAAFPWLKGKMGAKGAEGGAEGPAPLTAREVFAVGGLGILGSYLASIFDLMGLKYVTAGTERLILYVYPTLVVLFSAWFLRKRIGRNMILPLILSYAGIAVSFGGEALMGRERPHLGGMLIFVSAVCYALFLVGQGRMLMRAGPQRFTAYGMLFATGAVLAHFAIQYPLSALSLPRPVYALTFVVALFSTVLPAWLLSYGMQYVGAGRAAVVSSVGPASTFLLAAGLLHERAGLLQMAGLGLVTAGGLKLGLSKADPAGRTKA